MDTYNGADAANACIAKINGNSFDPAAVDVCAYMDTYNGSDAALNCLGSIANAENNAQARANGIAAEPVHCRAAKVSAGDAIWPRPKSSAATSSSRVLTRKAGCGR